MDVSRLPRVGAVLFEADFGQFAARGDPRGDIGSMIGGNSRHVRRVHIVDRVRTLARIERCIHELLRCVLRVIGLPLAQPSSAIQGERRVKLH